MESKVIDRKFSLLLCEISISNALAMNLQSYRRLLIPVIVTSIIAAVSLHGLAQWVALFIAIYSFVMVIEIGLRARRAERIEGALHGLALASEFGLLDSETGLPTGVIDYMTDLVGKRRRIWTAEAALEIIQGDMDLGRTIEGYSATLGLSKKQ